MNIYPNPASDFVNIQILQDKNVENVIIKVTDINGQIIFNKEHNSSIEQIDVSNYQKGIYFIKIVGQDIIKVEKMIIY